MKHTRSGLQVSQTTTTNAIEITEHRGVSQVILQEKVGVLYVMCVIQKVLIFTYSNYPNLPLT